MKKSKRAKRAKIINLCERVPDLDCPMHFTIYERDSGNHYNFTANFEQLTDLTDEILEKLGGEYAEHNIHITTTKFVSVDELMEKLS